MTVVDPAVLLAGHRCGVLCTRVDHGEWVWLADADGPAELDRQALAAGIVLDDIAAPSSRRGAPGRPARPQGLTAAHRPWRATWRRQEPVTTPAATDAPQQGQGGVGPDQQDGEQLELPLDCAPVYASPQRALRSRRRT